MPIGQDRVEVTIVVNSTVHVREVPARLLLVDFIRQELGLTGTHIGCDSTNCGACTVHLDGRNVKSCTIFAVQADEHEILTIEGVADEEGLGRLQQEFQNHGALQCGYCTPGMVMSALALMEANAHLGRDQIRDGLSGNLCRCTGYLPIVDAVAAAAGAADGADET